MVHKTIKMKEKKQNWAENGFLLYYWSPIMGRNIQGLCVCYSLSLVGSSSREENDFGLTTEAYLNILYLEAQLIAFLYELYFM